MVTIANFALCVWLSGVVLDFTESRNYRMLRTFYYIYGIATPLGVALATLLQMPVNLMFVFIGPAEPELRVNIYRISGVILCFALANAFASIFAKRTICHIDPNAFWYELAILVWRRRTMRGLLVGIHEAVKKVAGVSIRIESLLDPQVRIIFFFPSFSLKLSLGGDPGGRREVVCEHGHGTAEELYFARLWIQRFL